MHKIEIGNGCRNVEFDNKTEKQLIVMRGIPGSGKSFVSNAFRDKSDAVVVSADDYFRDENGRYNFVAAELGNAHADCFRRFVGHINQGMATVIVDNTNLRAYEYAPYLTYGNAHGYETMLIHKVPSNILLNMWGTFTNETVPGHYKHTVIVNEPDF